jgi:4-phytase/acid phosphatase
LIRSKNGWFAAALIAATCTALLAQTTTRTPSPDQHADRLKLVVVLSRHGVRSPTWGADRLNAYSALPWPAWSVQPGFLTARGYDLIKRFGSYDRAAFAQEGLLEPTGCADAATTYIWADTDQRTLATGHALAEGLFPGCDSGRAPKVDSLASGENDPLFHPVTGPVTSAAASASLAEVTQALAELPSGSTDELLQQIQRILRDCNPTADCTPAHMPDTRLLVGKNTAAPGKEDKPAGIKGPLPIGSSLSEDLLLEYAEGMPLQQVGWGHADQAEIGRLLDLHTAYFALVHRTPTLARLEASNMLDTITKTLQQGVEGAAVEGAKGPAKDKLVLIAGHDTNLGGVAALLGLHWTLDGRTDDTPPGTELAFELWQTPQGASYIRVRVAAQTLHQLRTMQPLTLADPPASEVVTPQGCSKTTASCGWQQFLTLCNATTGR